MKKRYVHNLILALSIVLSASFAHAQAVAVDQPLSFGKIVIVDFSLQANVTIQDNGGFSTNSNTFLLESPTRGEYTVTGADPNVLYSITVPTSVVLTGPGGGFTLDNIVVGPAVLMTDVSGEDEFRLSGSLTSSGGGVSYGDGAYDDTFNIVLNF